MDFKENPSAEFKDIKELKKADARHEIQKLREGIDYHDYLYYVKNNPRISDSLYDKLFHRLERLEEAFPDLKSEDSPTQRVGTKPVSKLNKIRHQSPMLSLKAALELKEIKKYYDFILNRIDDGKAEFVLEPKFDGLSVELVYDEGRLKYGATRGDGVTGEDITANLKTIRSVPLRINKVKGAPESISVRGEIFIPGAGFQELNKRRIEQNEDPFSNPRNAASGIIRQLDSKKVADMPLDILFYDILSIEEDKGPDTHWEALNRFPDWGFKTGSRNVRCSSFKEIEEYREKMSRARDDLEYDIDGVVIKLNSFKLREKIGVRERSPRWAFAWKFPPREEVTRLKKIVVQVGRTGMLTPVALLDPVDVGGVTVSRATLHNEDEVLKKDIREGDLVRIARAGDVIPEITERVERRGRKQNDPFSMPENCPACDTAVQKEGAYYFCPARLKCPPQLTGAVIHYASRDALNIEGLGKKTARDMVDKEMIKDISDLYSLKEEDFLKLEGFAEKSARKLYKAVQNAKNPELARFLYGLGIRHTGQHISGILAQKFGTFNKLREADRKDLEDIEEIGRETADSVLKFFNEPENIKIIDRIEKSGVRVKEYNKRAESSSLSGKKFVFTGKLKDFTRQEAMDAVERLGGLATSSVSGETDYVVTGEDPGSKYEKAREEKVEIIDENEFKRIIS